MNWTETRARLTECGIDAAKLPEEWKLLINLRTVNLRWADLRWVDLRGADLRWANLRWVDLRWADLRWADLRWADLRGANLRGADLRWVDLREADLADIKTSYLTIGIHDAPAGDLICWGKKSGVIVKMMIPADSPRSCATTRKHRAAWAKTLEIDGDTVRLEHSTVHGTVVYEIGEVIRADSWDENRWRECSHGIHFFLTREEAEAWV